MRAHHVAETDLALFAHPHTQTEHDGENQKQTHGETNGEAQFVEGCSWWRRAMFDWLTAK
jgi:hypothetical protein